MGKARTFRLRSVVSGPLPIVLRQCLYCQRWMLKPHGDGFCTGGLCSYRYRVGWRQLTCAVCGASYMGNAYTLCKACVAERRRRSGGWATKAKRLRIANRDRWRCWLCTHKVEQADWSLDHVVPRALGGSDRDDNLRLAHHRCNGKRGWDVTVQLALPV